jgi:hypothetical protein
MAQKHTFQRISGLSYDTFEEIFFLSFIYLKADTQRLKNMLQRIKNVITNYVY